MEKKDIEIPFRAFDSELGGFEYTIPEGYKAEIKDGKVIVKKAESEDERIRNGIIEFIKINLPYASSWLAWLEKKGEQKSTLPKWKYKKDNTPLLRDSLILNKYGCVAKSPSGAIVSDVWIIDYDELAKLPKEESEKQGKQILANSVKTCKDEQKPAWSEEDESKMRCLIAFLDTNPNSVIYSRPKEEWIKWLKSIRPQSHWKPSEEQMTAIQSAIGIVGELTPTALKLKELREQLKKLTE